MEGRAAGGQEHRRKGTTTPPANEGPGPGLRPPSFAVTRTGGTVVVTVRGEVGADAWSVVDAILRDLIDAQGNLDVVLDLGDVVALEGNALPLIVDAAHQAHRHGGHLRLADRACRDRWPGRPPGALGRAPEV